MFDPYAINVVHSELNPVSRLPNLILKTNDELKRQVLGSDFSPDPSSFNSYTTSTQSQNYPYEKKTTIAKAGAVLSLGLGLNLMVGGGG
jgi:hypothetical protein